MRHLQLVHHGEVKIAETNAAMATWGYVATIIFVTSPCTSVPESRELHAGRTQFVGLAGSEVRVLVRVEHGVRSLPNLGLDRYFSV